MLGECLTFGINGSFGLPGKKLRINFSQASTKLCFSLHYNVDNSYLFASGKFKAGNKNVYFPNQYRFSATRSR